ncbi:hypothetical protein ACOMHN_054005 [Nucella lapillus]
MLFLRPATPQSLNLYQGASDRDSADCDSTPTTPSASQVATPTPSSGSSSNSLPSVSSPVARHQRARPHTISAGSEKAYSRMPLKPELFEPLPEKAELVEGAVKREGHGQGRAGGKVRSHSSSGATYGRQAGATINKMQPVLPPHCPRPKVKAVPPPALPPGAQPVYANTADLQRMATENQAQQQQQQQHHQHQAGSATHAQPPDAPVPPADEDSAASALNLEEAIRSLDSVTAALVTDIPEEEATAAVAAEREAAERREQEDLEMRRAARSNKASPRPLPTMDHPGRRPSGGYLPPCSSLPGVFFFTYLLLLPCRPSLA